MKPTIGRIVLYRTDARNGLQYDLPAIITCTRETHPGDYPDGSKNPLPVPESDMHIHLTVLSPGGFGTRVIDEGVVPPRTPYSSKDFKNAEGIVPGSGTYVEWNVKFSEDAEPRSWRWPVIQK